VLGLPCSDLTYAEASWTQDHEDWLGAHVRAFAYIGGCPKKVIPDNLVREKCPHTLRRSDRKARLHDRRLGAGVPHIGDVARV
jgi:transposase